MRWSPPAQLDLLKQREVRLSTCSLAAALLGTWELKLPHMRTYFTLGLTQSTAYMLPGIMRVRGVHTITST